MGGNEELTPLKAAFNLLDTDKSGCSKNIFLLTDGGVGYGGNCTAAQLVQYGKDHKQTAAVHTIGVGSGVEADFCREMAEKSGGKCTFVTETDMKNDEMSGLVINALDMAAEVGLHNTQIHFSGAPSLRFQSPEHPQFLRDGQLFHATAIVNSDELKNLNIEFSFKNPRLNYELSTFKYSGDDFVHVG